MPFDSTRVTSRATVSRTDNGLTLVIPPARSALLSIADVLVIAAPRWCSMLKPRLVDVLVVHAEVMGDLVQHRVVHLLDEFGARSAPPFNVVLQQYDPLGVPRRAERRLGTALKVAEHTLVDAAAAIVVGGVRLNRDHEIVGVHLGAQRGRDTFEGIGGDALELVRGDVIRHALRMSHGRSPSGPGSRGSASAGLSTRDVGPSDRSARVRLARHRSPGGDTESRRDDDGEQ